LADLHSLRVFLLVLIKKRICNLLRIFKTSDDVCRAAHLNRLSIKWFPLLPFSTCKVGLYSDRQLFCFSI